MTNMLHTVVHSVDWLNIHITLAAVITCLMNHRIVNGYVQVYGLFCLYVAWAQQATCQIETQNRCGRSFMFLWTQLGIGWRLEWKCWDYDLDSICDSQENLSDLMVSTLSYNGLFGNCNVNVNIVEESNRPKLSWKCRYVSANFRRRCTLDLCLLEHR